MGTKTIWIIVGIIVLLMIVFAVVAMKSKPAVIPINNNPTPIPNTHSASTGNFLGDLLGGFITKWANRNITHDSGYTQIEPIDSDGCDANGYNAIGVRCFSGL